MSKSTRKPANRKPTRKSGNPAATSKTHVADDYDAAYVISPAQVWSITLLNTIPALAAELVNDDEIANIYRAHGFSSDPDAAMAVKVREMVIPFMLGFTPEILVVSEGDIPVVTINERDGSITVTANDSALTEAWQNACDAELFGERWEELLELISHVGHPVPEDAYKVRCRHGAEFGPHVVVPVTGR